jgi:hypothetical protein
MSPSRPLARALPAIPSRRPALPETPDWQAPRRLAGQNRHVVKCLPLLIVGMIPQGGGGKANSSTTFRAKNGKN